MDIENRMIEFLLKDATEEQVNQFFGCKTPAFNREDIEDVLDQMPDYKFLMLVGAFGLTERVTTLTPCGIGTEPELFEPDDQSQVQATSSTDVSFPCVWARIKAWVLAMDVDKVESLSDKLNSMTKSRWFQFVVIFAAVLIAFTMR